MTTNNAIVLLYTRIRGKPNTLASYRGTLEGFKAIFGIREVSGILPVEIQNYLKSLPVSESTRFLRFTHLKILFNLALKEEKINGHKPIWDNPCDLLSNDFKKPEKNGKPISDTINDDMHSMETKLKERHQLIFQLGTRSGLRIGEILKITPEDIIRNEDTCCIRLVSPKSGANQEMAWLPLDLCQELWEYIDKGGIGAKERVFSMTKQAVWMVFHRFGVKPHDLRRYAAYRLMEKGKNLKVIQGFLRHKSPKTTEIYLGNLSINALAKELEGM
jgi:integrase/recombinase XerD